MDEISYSRTELAREQLDSALKLFMCKSPRFASALTLAGAAEEILGKALEKEGKLSAIQHWYRGKAGNRSAGEAPLTWKVHAAEENHARNSVKHMQGEDLASIPSGLQDAAAMMLYRACSNCEWLGLAKTWRMRRFDTWFLKWAT